MANSMNYINVSYWVITMMMMMIYRLHDPWQMAQASRVSVPLYKIGIIIIITIITASKGPCGNLSKVTHVKHFALLQCLPTPSAP